MYFIIKVAWDHTGDIITHFLQIVKNHLCPYRVKIAQNMPLKEDFSLLFINNFFILKDTANLKGAMES